MKNNFELVESIAADVLRKLQTHWFDTAQDLVAFLNTERPHVIASGQCAETDSFYVVVEVAS